MAGRLDKWREELAGRIFVKGRSGYVGVGKKD